MKLEDLRTIAKYRPDALFLKGGEDGKEPIFGISVTTGAGDINVYGATFGAATHDDKKLATITVAATCVEGDIREFVADKLGSAIINLNKLEATLPAVINEIASEKKTVMDNITIAQ